MRNIAVEEVDGVDRAVLAIGTDFPPGHELPFHQHRRAQLLYGATGVMRVQTADGSWTVPPQQAVLIPAATRHQVTMLGVSTRSLYIEPAAVPWFPTTCTVVEVSTLLRELLLEAVALPAEYNVHGRDGAVISLILHELSQAAAIPFELPLPSHGPLRTLCERFLEHPHRHPPSQWAQSIHVSERTLNRLFRSQTGMSASQWQRRACVLEALPLLAAGHSISVISAELGYATPTAFSTMFQRIAGAPPSSYAPKAGS